MLHFGFKQIWKGYICGKIISIITLYHFYYLPTNYYIFWCKPFMHSYSGNVKLMRKIDLVLELNNVPMQRDKTTL